MRPLINPARLVPALTTGGGICILEFGITPLVPGQAYIDVVFASAQPDTDWDTQCSVVNTTDATPLNIWPGIITAKATTGFRLQLNGFPDTSNYFLHWAITPGSSDPPPPPAATTYTLTGPSTGFTGVASTNFTVALSPVGGIVTGTVTVTPSSGGGGGSFTPSSVGLTTGAPSATFTYTPASSGAKTISVTNDGGLTNPGNLTYTASASPGAGLLDTLISYWKLDEASGTRNDSHGTNHLAAFAAPVGATGKINNGCQFVSASTQYLTLASNSTLQVTSDFTWSLWVKFASVASIQFLVGKDSGGATVNRDYSVAYHNTAGFLFSVKDPALYAVAVGSPVSAGTWFHVVAWYDSSDQLMRIRINDTTTYTSAMTSTLTQTAAALQFGVDAADVGTPVSLFDGILDEVGFWKRKLTAGQITALYNSGSGLPYSSFTP